jgi:hypothetical protein
MLQHHRRSYSEASQTLTETELAVQPPYSIADGYTFVRVGRGQETHWGRPGDGRTVGHQHSIFTQSYAVRASAVTCTRCLAFLERHS